MTGQHDDQDLRDALQQSVADVEPAYRLDQIRSRTRPSTEEVPMKENTRTWLIGAAGAVLATAAVIVTVAVIGTGGDDDSTPTAGDPSESASVEPTPSEEFSASANPGRGDDTDDAGGEDGGGVEVTVPVYYTVDTPVGPRLVREFRRVGAQDRSVDGRMTAALETAVTMTPADPDYSTTWPEDSVVDVSRTGGTWTVAVASESTDLGGRPDGVDAEQAEAMRQQLVFTAQAILQERTPIVLTRGDDAPLLGPDAGPVTAAAEVDALALMNVTNPVQGQTVRGDTLAADGRSNGPEANVVWEIHAGDADGQVVDEGFTTAEGWMGDRLFGWSVDIDVSGLEPGAYTFVARNDDPTGGQEGVGDSADSKAFTIE